MLNYKCFMFFVLLLCSAVVFAEPVMDSAADGKTEALENDVARLNKLCIQLEHDAVYKDPKVKVVYDRVKKLEKQLHQAREDLVKELEQVPEIKKARADRKRAYAKLLEERKAGSRGDGAQ